MPTRADAKIWWPSTSNGYSSDLPQPLGDHHRGAGLGDVVDQHHELVAAQPRQREARLVAGHDVGGAQARLQAAGHGHEQAIGRERAEAVVHDPESIERERQDRELVLGAALGALDRALDEIDEQQPVRQAGERIGQLGLGDVGQRSGQPAGHARFGPDRGAAAAHPSIGVVAMPEAMLALEVSRRVGEVARSTPPARRRYRRDARATAIHPPTFRSLPSRVRGSIPARRPIHLAADQIPVPQAVVRALHGQRIPLFALAEVGDRPLVARDASRCARPATGKSIGLVT